MNDTPTTGVAQATPDGELRRQILSPCVAKNEREWWASGTIEKLECELNAANDRIKRLEEAGDKMDETAEPFVLDTIDEDTPMSKVGEQYEIIYDSPPTAGDHVAMDRARKQWRKAKEAKP